MSNPSCHHLSASSIAAFKACPTRFRLAYREGLRKIEDTDSQRMGTNWHKMHEVYAYEFSRHCPDCGGRAEDYALDGVIAHLNERYSVAPPNKTALEWAVEREILYRSFVAYLWYYQNDPITVLATEVPFKLPVKSPRVGMNLPTDEVVRVGKIDSIIRWQNAVCALERKSTSKSLDAESDFWDRSQKDSQVSMYALAFRDMVQFGNEDGFFKPGFFQKHCELHGATRFGNTLYDVWRKPTIKPAMLTQKETAEFLQSGVYCGQRFDVEQAFSEKPTNPPIVVHGVFVNREVCEVEEGKKGFAIRETVEMYGARLLNDIYERPEHYFVRREIARTDRDLVAFERQLFAIYQSQKLAEKYNAWVENEQQCRATFRCPYISICYSPAGADGVCDGKTEVPNFKRIFTDLTIEGEEV